VGAVWIGYTDQKKEGQWKWISPVGTCNKYTNWRKNEPNNMGNEDCAAMVKGWNGQWNDAGCNAKHEFICEIGFPAGRLY
jgi:hypothetical protein